MDTLDILILAIEASIALAGFAGIIATFQFGNAVNVRRADAVGLALIVQNSLLCALGSSIPLALLTFEIGEEIVWSIGSCLMAMLLLATQIGQTRNSGHSVKDVSFKKIVVLIHCASISMVLINAMNVADYVFHREPGPLIAAVVWGLSLSGFMFARLLLRPIWRSVRRYEAAVESGVSAS